MLCQPVLRLVERKGFGFGAARFGLVGICPAGERRQGHKDRLSPALRGKTECRASIVDKIKLYIAASSQKLKAPLAFTIGFMPAPLDDRKIRCKHVSAAIAHKRKNSLQIILQIVKKNSAYAAHLAAVGNGEILIAPLFKSRIKRRVVTIANLLPCAVKEDDILAFGVVWGEIAAATEPCLRAANEVAEVRMHCRHHGTGGMEHHRDPAGKKLWLSPSELGQSALIQFAPHGGRVRTRFFKKPTICQRGSCSAPTAGAFPSVEAKMCFSVNSLKLRTKRLLLRLK